MQNSQVKNEKANVKWIRCKNCGHKLMKVLNEQQSSTVIEIKCSSCKAITVIDIK